VCSTDPVFDENFVFEFTGESNSKFDATMLAKLNQPLHITILKHRKNDRAVVIGTKAIEWRHVLHSN
jgi:hypothetical protein